MAHPTIAAATIAAGFIVAQVADPPTIAGQSPYGIVAAGVAAVIAVAGYLRARAAEKAAGLSADRAAVLQDRAATTAELEAVVEAQRGLNDLLSAANRRQGETIKALRGRIARQDDRLAALDEAVRRCEEHKSALGLRVEELGRHVQDIIQDPTGPTPIVGEASD
jgi:hypothetical protein